MIDRHGLVLLSLCLGLNAFLIDYSFDQIWLGLTSKFKSKCASVGGPQAYSDLQVAVRDLNGCAPIEFNKPDTICTEQRGKSYKCYEDFFEKFQKCIDPQEVYIKNLVLFAHNITFDNNCRDEGNDLLGKIA
uniref:Uncharacterized protein n=1 Tax=Photinus pyralis TaxID=7054 RepID=A0A1Y1K1V7_PHOPY